ncbi:MAG: NAD(P)H-hydrate dehydratase [Ignavibacterium sp.]
MIPLYTNSQIRALDSFAINQLQTPGIVLMENASIGISQTILSKYSHIKSVGIICGKGNNGGDGFAVARHLSNYGLNVKVIYLGDPQSMSDDCRTNFEICLNLSQQRNNLELIQFSGIKQLRELRNSDLIIDAILGSGFSGPLKEPISLILTELNKLKVIKVAIDVPTGLNADTGYADIIFKADLTITLGEFKKGLFVGKGYENCGEIVLCEIGVGRDYFENELTNTFLIEPEDANQFLPQRGKSINKYSAGKVLTIAGSFQYPGAAVLTAGSSLYSGAGASILTVPQTVKKFVHKKITELVVQSFGDEESKSLTPKDYQSLQSKIKWADVVALGPGIGRTDETVEFVHKFIKKHEYKVAVIDADALFALKDFLADADLRKCILTPHLGEFSALINIPASEIEKNIFETGIEFVKKYKTTLVLKGAPTITFTKEGDIIINSSGNNGLAKFGSGDVLTGMIAGFYSQTKNLTESALLSVYLHGLSADLLLQRKTEFGIMASDLMKNIPATINFIKRSFEK